MAIADLRVAVSSREPLVPTRRQVGVRTRKKPPLVLRPLHGIWRRTIDGIEVARVALPVRGFPPTLKGTVACQISDLHLDRDEDVARLERAVGLINREAPDLVFLTGDYFSRPETMRRYVGAMRRVLGALKPRVGVMAVAGNHDHWCSFDRVAEALRRTGVEVLSNESRRIAVGGGELVVVGVDDLWSRRAEPARAFRDVRHGDCTIVLAHNPDTALYLRHLKPGVMLSGHTHGGVVRIPLYGSPIQAVLRLGRKFYAGLNRYGDFYIYTNRGLGTFWVRVRLNCRPEISCFSLTPLASELPRSLLKNPRRARVVRQR